MSVDLEIGADGIGILALDRPESGNAIDLDAAEALQARVLECGRRTDLRALILCGRGGAFCVGGDLDYIREADDRRPQALRRLVDAVNTAARRMRTLNVPLIAAVEGPAAGFGLSLVCLSDLAVASKESSFTVAYTAVGLSPDGGCSKLLPEIVGPRVAADLMLTNRRMSAAEAAAAGLINEVVQSGEALDRARELGRRIARFPRNAVAATRSLMLGAPDRSLDSHLELEAVTISGLSGEPECAAAVEAFLSRGSKSRKES